MEKSNTLEIIDDVKKGKMVIIVDDESLESFPFDTAPHRRLLKFINRLTIQQGVYRIPQVFSGYFYIITWRGVVESASVD